MHIRLPFLALLVWCSYCAVAQPAPVRTENILFPPLPIGSTRELEQIVRGLSANGVYQIVKAPQAPFAFTSSAQDLTVRNGEIRLRVKFSPQTEGDFSEEMLLERQPKTGNPAENTIRVRLNAVAFRIERTEEIDFGTIDVADSVRRPLLFRTGPSDEVRWEYTRRPRAPFQTSTYDGPIRRGRDTLAFVMSFHPTEAGRFRDTVGIIRISRQGQRLDTAWFYLTGSARARPLRLRLTPDAETYSVRIGDTLSVGIRIVSDGPVDAVERLQQLSFEVGYNPTLLVPLLNYVMPRESLSVRDGLQYMNIGLETFTGGSITIDTEPVALMTLRFLVTLGDAESTPLRLDSFRYVDRNNVEQRPATTSSNVNITNVWRYQDGRSRLINPLQGSLILDVDPNPVETFATMRVRNVPQTGGTLIVTDPNGRIVANLTNDIIAGKRDFTVASSGAADMTLPRGTYYARLAVQSELGGTLLSVVRLFIVQ